MPLIAKIDQQQEENDDNNKDDDTLRHEALSLNVAYESLELVRKANLQWEFGEDVDVNQCIPCLIEKNEKEKEIANTSLTSSSSSVSSRWQSFTKRSQSTDQEQKENGNSSSSRSSRWSQSFTKRPIVADPCLTCGGTVCRKHRSKDFGRQNITICNNCSPLFSIEYLVESIVNMEIGNDGLPDKESRRKKINHILEVYDRALLVLKYSLPFIDEIATALAANTSRHNKVGLGSSATGVLSGALGVAAAATILTPVGPPLLIASILFGGSATAATAGSEAVNYSSDANKMSDKIIALHGIVKSITLIPATIDMGAGDTTDDGRSSSDFNKKLHMQRTTMNVLRPLTAGALSAISIVTEAREMSSTIKKIRDGNPCEKAEILNNIKQETDNNMPETSVLASQLEVIANRYTPKEAI